MQPRPRQEVGWGRERCTCAKSNTGPGAPLARGWGSVVLLWLLPLGHPVFLAPAGQEAAGLVALLLPDPHRVVLGHDPVVTGPLEEVTLWGQGEEREGGDKRSVWSWKGQCGAAV